jgi:hypothetical protein
MRDRHSATVHGERALSAAWSVASASADESVLVFRRLSQAIDVARALARRSQAAWRRCDEPMSAEQAQHVLRGNDHRRASGVQTRATDDRRQPSGNEHDHRGILNLVDRTVASAHAT